jgi:hypothetical protein
MEKLFLVIFTTLFVFIHDLEAAEQNFQFHGFVAQGMIEVDGSNFVNDDGSLSPELTEVGINASYQLNSKLRLTGQVVYLNGGNRYAEDVRVDYALLDWSVYESLGWQANIYLGRYKNHHWLYSSTRDIPFARPSIVLPQSIYFDGFRDIAVGADGGALKISYNSDTLGDFDFNITTGSSPISKEQTQIILGKLAFGEMKHTYDLQTSLYWQPFLSPWRFGLAIVDGDFEYQAAEKGDMFQDADITLQRVIANALYEGENWEFSGEIMQERFIFDGFYFSGFHNDSIGQGVYVQSRYKVNSDLTLLARYERLYTNKDDKNGSDLEYTSQGMTPSYFGFQNDATFGFSYDLTDNFRLQFEYHYIEGTARLTPVVLPNPKINDSKSWQLWAAQLMYWF